LTVGSGLAIVEKREPALLVEQLGGRDEAYPLCRRHRFEVHWIASQQELTETARDAQLGTQRLHDGGLRFAKLNGHSPTLE
jgi:hypothetical protein